MALIRYTIKEFKRGKKEILTNDEYIFLRDNYNRFLKEEKRKNKAELKLLYQNEYSFKSVFKYFIYWLIGGGVIVTIITIFPETASFLEFYGLGFIIFMFAFFGIVSSRLFTSGSFDSYFTEFKSFYYKHRLAIEETDSYSEYVEYIQQKNKSILRKLLNER